MKFVPLSVSISFGIPILEKNCIRQKVTALALIFFNGNANDQYIFIVEVGID